MKDKKFCFKCGKEIPSDVDFCPYCGAKQIVNSDSNGSISNNNLGDHKPGLITSTKLYFNDMAVVDKRMSRADFWWSYLGMVLLSFTVFFASGLLNTITSNSLSDAIIFLTGGAEAILGIASFTASIRRLHDVEHSGWLILLGLIPIVGAIILIVLYCQPSVKNSERFTANAHAEWYKKWWVWVIAVFAGLVFVGGQQAAVTPSSPSTASTKVKNTDSSSKEESEHDTDYGDEDDTNSSNTASSEESEPQEPESKASSTSKVSTEYKNALETAEEYSDNMYMSKAGIYEQLSSDAGEQFSAGAAQYAVDNLKADYNKNALETAKNYQSEMHMSTEEIRDQLTSEAGEQFTPAEADYAINHLGN